MPHAVPNPRHVITILCVCLLGSAPAFAQPDANQALIDLLVRKGVLTAADVAELRKEVVAQNNPPSQPAAQLPIPSAATAASPGPVANPDKAVVLGGDKSPLSFRIGAADFTPFGFMDFTTVYRSTDVGSGISTNFAGIPYRNTSAGQLSETRFSAQNSRLGLRVDSQVDDTDVLGYVETDFLGNAASTLNVTSNAATLRMRLYFADFKRGHWEFLAGQSWSMLTPNRVGISPLPSDISYTMDMDIAYQAGLVWARQPQVRLVYRTDDGLSAGVSVENPDQYVGGANGSPSVTLPSGFNAAEVDNGTASTSPNRMPDIIGKLAYDTKLDGLPWHAELAGVLRSFEINTYTAGADPVNIDSSATGYGGAFNVDLEILKNLSLIGDAYVSQGGGRYIFGQAPDFVVNPANAAGAYTLSTLAAQSYIGGLEWKATPNTTVFGYASTVEIGRKSDKLASGSFAGYGYAGSPNTQNKDIDEFTLGASETIWKSSEYGALQLIGQVSYVDREPWFVAAGQPGKADAAMVFVDLRYVLP